ncbi:hypothetical protein QFC21_004376 [Naganishia friedmannii]|uniref:Uncharacterized protein n=1 Tax=Naganishia friedmannii TaxID=89922 RepID=A0ACC2VHW9_9TREE|nr:hypothetical protein QFC21_004376 [Naganishia friedmannii]
MSSLVNAALNQAGIVRPANSGPGGRGVVGSVVGHSANNGNGQSSRMEIEGGGRDAGGADRTRRDGGREGRGGRGGGGYGGKARKGGRNGGDHQKPSPPTTQDTKEITGRFLGPSKRWHEAVRAQLLLPWLLKMTRVYRVYVILHAGKAFIMFTLASLRVSLALESAGSGRHDPLSTSSRSRRPPGAGPSSSSSAAAARDGNDAPGAVIVDAKKAAAAAARHEGKNTKGGSHIVVIKEWLATRVRGPGILDLHSMISDPLLVGPGIKMPGHPEARMIHGEVFWKCIAEQDPHTHTLRLSHNNLRDLKILSTLPKWLPHIRALDLSDNEGLQKLGQLDVLSTHSCMSQSKDSVHRLGLYNLRELKLTNTKIRRDAETGNRLTTYLRRFSDDSDVIARFPNLTMLDEELVPRITFPVGVDYPIKAIEAQEMEQIRAKPFCWPYDVTGNLVETLELDAFATTFLAKFFEAFDSDRSVLVPVYAPQATLSFNITTTAPRRKIPNVVVPAPGKHSFDTWTEHNRNLVRIGKNRRVNTLVVSDEAVTRLSEWLEKTVPRTQHPLHDPTKWIYDVLPLDAMAGVGRIMLTIHGEFLEVGKQLVRSFSRNMILAEVQPGTPAAAAGWPGLILSDSISVRSACDTANFTKSLAVAGAQIVPRHTGPPPLPPGVSAEIAAIPGLSPEQMLAVMQVQHGTNLVTSTALDCAQIADFNVEIAMAKFRELQAQIPAEFFRHVQ